MGGCGRGRKREEEEEEGRNKVKEFGWYVVGSGSGGGDGGDGGDGGCDGGDGGVEWCHLLKCLFYRRYLVPVYSIFHSILDAPFLLLSVFIFTIIYFILL